MTTFCLSPHLVLQLTLLQLITVLANAVQGLYSIIFAAPFGPAFVAHMLTLVDISGCSLVVPRKLPQFTELRYSFGIELAVTIELRFGV